MPSLTIDSQTTVTNTPTQNLSAVVNNTALLGVVTVTGPVGPSGASIVGPVGPMGGTNFSGYATGLSSGPLGSPLVFRATTGQLIELFGDGASGNAPSISNLNVPILQPIHGTTGALLGAPDGWWSFLVSGRSARIPYYYA